jgi:hypothetical protein
MFDKKAYYKAHKEERIAYSRMYRETHKKEVAAKKKIYCETHKEEIAIRNKAYHETHKKELAVKHRAYHETHKEESRVYHKVHREKRNSQRLENKYGITLEDKRIMWKTQDGKCLICKKKLTKSKDCHIDHCHATGKIRGLLCHKCNSLLGCANDDLAILQSAVDYIRKNL